MEGRTLPVARTRKGKPKANHNKKKVAESSSAELEEDPFEVPMTTQEIYAGLGPVGKAVAGTVEIAVSTIMEYFTGFIGGFVIGSVAGFPGFVFRSMDTEQTLPLMQEITQRFQRMNSRSVRWAKSWGGISAAFGGFRVATRVVRGGKEVRIYLRNFFYPVSSFFHYILF